MNTPASGNPITSAILTARNAVHYTITPNGDEQHNGGGFIKLCDGRPVTHAKRTTVGALTCSRCAAKAERNNWPMDGATNTHPLTKGMTVMVTQGFAQYMTATIEKVTACMYHNPTDGLVYHIGDDVTVLLGTWGLRHLNADIFEPRA